MKNKRTILFFAANATGRAALKLPEEGSRLSDIFDKPELEPYYEFKRKDNLTVDKFLGYIQKFQPWMLHFSGHGIENGGIVLEKPKRSKDARTINKDVLAETVRFCSSIRGVFFNSCHSAIMAADFKEHVDFFIGFHGEVDDNEAVKFSEAFYQTFTKYDSISFAIQYMMHELWLRKPKGIIPCFDYKINFDEMDPIVLEQLIEDKQRIGGALDTEILELQNTLASIKENGMGLRDELMEDHPHKFIVHWFVTNREMLEKRLATDGLPRYAEQSEVETTAKEIHILLNFFEFTLLNFDLEDLLSPEEINEYVQEFDHHPKGFYKTCIMQLGQMAERTVFTPAAKAYFKDTVKFYCSLF